MSEPIASLPELPYRLPDGTVLRSAEDIEVGIERVWVVVRDLRARLEHAKKTGALPPKLDAIRATLRPWGRAHGDLPILMRLHGRKYDKQRAHALLDRASAALVDVDPELAIEIEEYLKPRLARHPEALEEVAG